MVRVLYHWLRKLWSSTNVHFMDRNTIVKIGLQVSLLPYMHRVILLRNWRYTLYLAIPTLCSFADGVFYSHNLFALWLWLAICLITPGKRSKVTIWKVNSRLQSRGKLSQMNDEHHDELCVILLYTFTVSVCEKMTNYLQAGSAEIWSWRKSHHFFMCSPQLRVKLCAVRMCNEMRQNNLKPFLDEHYFALQMRRTFLKKLHNWLNFLLNEERAV